MTPEVTVCGLGYVGLALAREASVAGLRVLGYDLASAVVETLGAGRSHVDDVDDGDLAAMTANGFTATDDPAALGASPVVVICVPTPLDRHGGPDLGPLYGAATGVANRLRPGMLVIVESTSYPGTTDEVVAPVLERASGLTAGVDFHLAFSPERIDPGNATYRLAKTPKVVGGYTAACGEAAAAFYRRFTETVVPARGTREAEMAKLLENVYRHVNIGLANEMAVLCERLGIDVWDVLECAATKPFGFQAFEPGPGVGGHCIPVDPQYLAYKARQVGFTSQLIDAASAVNRDMPAYVAERCARAVAARGGELAGSTVTMLGVAYKSGVGDTRMSPAYDLARALRARGASVVYHDPYVADWTVDRYAVPRYTDLDAALEAADLAVLLQRHPGYTPAALAGARLLFDARGLFAGAAGERVDVL